MDAGSLAHMSPAPFNQGHGLPAMGSGLASRRGGQNIKPLSFDGLKTGTPDNGLPTPRTSRSHLLAGLRTAPKSAAVSNFPNLPSPTTLGPQARNRNSMAAGAYDNTNLYGPKTSIPRFASQQQLPQQQQPQQQQQQQMYNPTLPFAQQYTADQVLAPPQIQLDEVRDQIDPTLHAQLLYTNAYLTEQQQRLQQQLRALQAAAQQFQGLSLGGQAPAMQQSYPAMYQQQMQASQAMMAQAAAQSGIYAVYDQASGQTLYMDQAQALNAQLHAQLNAQLANAYASAQQQQQQQQQPVVPTPRVQVSPPPTSAGQRVPSPPRRYDSPAETHTPLPPPSANAFRRGHKKTPSVSTSGKNQLSITTNDEPLKSAGPKTASFPLMPMTSGYGPGQARAGEHPIRQPRNPPSLDELKAKPTAKHEGSKNFLTRTRRSAVDNLVRAGLERRKEGRSSSGSISPISESTEEAIETPATDNESDSGRSGSGSLIDRDECSLPSSRTSTGSWGAIGSDRPSSRQKAHRSSVDTNASSDSENPREPGSFASLLKNNNRVSKAEAEVQRKAARLVLTSAEKRRVAA
ncbi:hypothetical protein VTJ83DRAFT_4060 [Remersonia thermophila]|uniref:Uncharacterized protein n=1 Tax=Remersonia thermophila TaxID=72144 RepID=A0ABR4DFZ1_9PEZI